MARERVCPLDFSRQFPKHVDSVKQSSHGLIIAGALVALSIALGASPLAAQTPPTPDQRRQASAAYDQGVAARASGNHASAASFFETADRLAPSSVALGNAIRAHRDAHSPAHDARAATLSLRLITRYPGDARAVAYSRNVVQELGSSLTRVTVRCDRCEVEIDHALSAEFEFFLEPGAHTVVGYWGTRTRSRTFTATSGANQTIALETPPEDTTHGVVAASSASPPPVHGGDSSSSGPSIIQPPPPNTGLPPAVALVGTVLTVGLGATLAWSTADMYAGVQPYEAAPSLVLLTDGQAREVRTDVLIGATAVVGAATVVTLIFTRWGGARHIEAAPAVSGAVGMAPGLSLRGSF